MKRTFTATGVLAPIILMTRLNPDIGYDEAVWIVSFILMFDFTQFSNISFGSSVKIVSTLKFFTDNED